MSDKSKISWTDASWQPVVGCTKVSPGCDNCYAEKMAGRLANMHQVKYMSFVLQKPGTGTIRYNKKAVYLQKWNNKTYYNGSAIDKPLHWKKARRIFVCSMGDLFHDSVPFEFIDKVIDVFVQCPQHTGILLTKRHERLLEYSKRINHEWLDNIIGMVTAENQKWADIRIPALLQCGFKTTGVSIEPMLGPMDITKYLLPTKLVDGHSWQPRPLWVIVGGESGPGARPMHPGWAREVRNQCKEAGVPFFFKQWGKFVAPKQTNYQGGGHGKNKEWRFPVSCSYMKYDGTYYPGYPSGGISAWTKIYGIGKKKAGDLLDGRKHREYPEVKP